MSFFDPLRDFFHRRQANFLNERAARVQLVTERAESLRGNFVFPGTDTFARIERDGQRVGSISYGINPLGDRVYVNEIDVDHKHGRQGIGLAALWILYQAHHVPIVPLHEVGTSKPFWRIARRRFAAAGAVLETDLRCSELPQAQERWQHLVPEPEHLRLQRELMASPEWPAIKARWDKEYGPCQ
ncbi:hypothetical protein SAMN05216593_108223 [Pseudomonas asturiensis]|uniref:Uncharacterized protein n=1 Tax=Pseudomonas asturiensis TaxID=1190415 RepID=A0A1M7P7S0_9PSED|nr:GNAT family N-acetyltransferase [Pseudomonas asturiensis]SHN12668.1 hypothetical protein SAMN05216593_108223 [Pseudomonas asturiensis]